MRDETIIDNNLKNIQKFNAISMNAKLNFIFYLQGNFK
jgi:hypothetical protein